MPTIYERPTSRTFGVELGNETEVLQYFVSGTGDAQEVYELLRDTSPVQLGALLTRKAIKAEALAGGHWFGDVEYGTLERNDAVGTEPGGVAAPSLESPLGPSFSLDTTGSTVHITQAIATRYRRTVADNGQPVNVVGTGPDEKRAIGLTKDRVEGTDIYAPALTFTKTVQRASVNLFYVNQALYGLTGRVNDAPFYGFNAGEVLYLGCTGNYTQRERWTLTHKFACQPNERDVDVGGGIIVPGKYGWDYLWVSYDPKVNGNKVLQEPTCCYVQQVYKPGDFSKLQIGVA